MLTQGNTKLGKLIWGFSIPAGHTCPGQSKLCSERCYAQKGFFTMPAVRRLQARNYESSLMDDFVERMIEEIRKKKCHVIRIHIAGDYYSAEYVRKWHQIVKACPDVIFFTYTRSWRIPEIRSAIEAYVNDCPNLRMWYSVDAETGNPEKVPERVRITYMSVAIYDIPDHRADLIFRDYEIRGIIQKRINGVLVCPPENGITDITCQKCGICWQRMDPPTKRLPDKQRIALQLIA